MSFKDRKLYLENQVFDIKNFTPKKEKQQQKAYYMFEQLVLPNQLNCTGLKPSMHTVSKKNWRKEHLNRVSLICIM